MCFIYILISFKVSFNFYQSYTCTFFFSGSQTWLKFRLLWENVLKSWSLDFTPGQLSKTLLEVWPRSWGFWRAPSDAAWMSAINIDLREIILQDIFKTRPNQTAISPSLSCPHLFSILQKQQIQLSELIHIVVTLIFLNSMIILLLLDFFGFNHLLTSHHGKYDSVLLHHHHLHLRKSHGPALTSSQYCYHLVTSIFRLCLSSLFPEFSLYSSLIQPPALPKVLSSHSVEISWGNLSHCPGTSHLDRPLFGLLQSDPPTISPGMPPFLVLDPLSSFCFFPSFVDFILWELLGREYMGVKVLRSWLSENSLFSHGVCLEIEF